MSKEIDKFLIYNTSNNEVRVNVYLENEMVWLTQKAIGESFGVNVPAICKHLSNIFQDFELVENSVISILETTATDGKKYKTKYYNLDAIISFGYCVNSSKASQFRIWATQTLKEYILKTFMLLYRIGFILQLQLNS